MNTQRDPQVFQPSDVEFESRVRASFDRQGAMALIGAQLVAVAPGTCEIRLPYRANLSQQHGFFHGGILTAVADSAAGYAGFSLMPADCSVLTIEFKTNFLAPAKGEALVCRARVIKPGRTITVAETAVSVLNKGVEKLCATLSETMMVVRDQAET